MVEILVNLILHITTVNLEGEIGLYEAIVGLVKSIVGFFDLFIS